MIKSKITVEFFPHISMSLVSLGYWTPRISGLDFFYLRMFPLEPDEISKVNNY